MNARVVHLFYSLAWVAIALVAGCEVRSDADSKPPAADLAAGESVEASAEASAGVAVTRGGLQFVTGYHRGFELAREQRKPMLVFFTAEWCTYCHQMEADAFRQDPVVSLSKQFVCILVDADCEPNVCRDFRVKGYPTIQFLSPRGVPLNRVTGKQPGPQLVMQMQAALQAVARRDGAGEAVRR
ncbi:MAG TPA: thioredoxin family protein [Pirellulales bacterium]|nr:thioredoxin family protein [Pirellulales bacterium]